jgi:KDO2-lipid IV(A) lauroyltransferase
MRIFEMPLYLLARAVVALLQALPLRWVARLGRAGGGLAWWLDARHRRVAVRNMTMCFGQEKSADEIRVLARENFRCIGENYACAVKTAAMTFEELEPHIEFIDEPGLRPAAARRENSNIVVAIGHFGNFELYARIIPIVPGYQFATTYRGLRQASLDRLLRSLRERSGCLFFERRFDAKALKASLNAGGILLGLLSDQHAGEGGLRIPFLGHECSTSAAPAVFSLRYDAALYASFCFRIGLAKWCVKVGRRIPTHENGRPRSSEAIMRDVNRAFEEAVRRDPANWFWVHNRWKLPKKSRRQDQKPEAQPPVSRDDLSKVAQ